MPSNVIDRWIPNSITTSTAECVALTRKVFSDMVLEKPSVPLILSTHTPASTTINILQKIPMKICISKNKASKNIQKAGERRAGERPHGH